MAFFSQGFIEQVRLANDIAQIIESYNIELRKSGTNLLALCPFHNEKTPSFTVKPSEQYFRCFGCGAKGNIFNFIQLIEKVDFVESVKILASRAGIPLEKTSFSNSQADNSRQELKTTFLWFYSQALEYFEEKLHSVAGRAALDYLYSRGFDKSTISKWRLGWAPDNGWGLINYFEKITKDTAYASKLYSYGVESGLFRVKKDEYTKTNLPKSVNYYDAFRGRLIFPILDTQLRPIAFGGRVLEEKPKHGGKYINSSESLLFEKRKVLYGLSFASKDISLNKTAIIVEGYTDVLMCHQYGIRNVVATLGTALTSDHVLLLKRYIQPGGKVIAFFDSDSAGEKATEKALKLFVQADIPLYIMRSPTLKDAAAFLPQFGVEEFNKQLLSAKSEFNYLIDKKLQNIHSGEVSMLSSALKEIMEVINLSPDSIKRSLLLNRLATDYGIPADILAQQNTFSFPREKIFTSLGGKNKYNNKSKSFFVPTKDYVLDKQEGKRKLEIRLLHFMWANPNWSQKIAHYYPPDEWNDLVCGDIAIAIRDQWDHHQQPDINTICKTCNNPDVSNILAELALPEEERPLSELELKSLLSRVELNRINEKYEEVFEEVKSSSDDEASQKEDLLKLLKVKELGSNFIETNSNFSLKFMVDQISKRKHDI